MRPHRVGVRTRGSVRHHPQRIRLSSPDVQRIGENASRHDDSRLLLAVIVPVYERYDSIATYVAISESNRHSSLHYAATIHHGIHTAQYVLHPEPGDHLLFFGRIHPDKGTVDAIEVARRCNRRLLIAGIIQDGEYFRHEVEPHIDGDGVRYVGPVSASDRADVLGGAHALLHLVHFDEPFGYSVVEAMACGTPVIAHRRGAMPELIHDGTGFLVEDIDGAIRAVDRCDQLDRAAIRASTVTRFDSSRMIDEYVALYDKVLARRA
ncbi:MAG: hypothetical protein JWN99_1071 [Ilumatobacteraceae bacterium]|nr:hypothetical protein [Ilumatobacteraceae bacterium]